MARVMVCLWVATVTYRVGVSLVHNSWWWALIVSLSASWWTWEALGNRGAS